MRQANQSSEGTPNRANDTPRDALPRLSDKAVSVVLQVARPARYIINSCWRTQNPLAFGQSGKMQQKAAFTAARPFSRSSENAFCVPWMKPAFLRSQPGL